VQADKGAFAGSELLACAQKGATDLAKQHASLGPMHGAAEVTLETTPSWNAFSDFVLTRLHTRYGKDALGEDLVFRTAEPIIGGREMRDAAGKLENAAQKSSFNNFQARYAIRHPWKGPATCANAKFGVWGPPPRGQTGSTTPKAARDLAFAPRDGVKLASFVAEAVPGLDVRPETPASRGCGGCAASSDGPPMGTASLLALLALLRRSTDRLRRKIIA